MADCTPSASDLMGLMYTAPERLSELCITARAWYKPREANAASQAWMATQAPGSVAALTMDDPASVPSEPRGDIVEETCRFRIRKTSSWQFAVERLDSRDGAAWAVGFDCHRMIWPMSLIPNIAVDSIEETVSAGRKCFAIRVRPRRLEIDIADSALWTRADEYELVVDAACGILMGLTEFRDGKAFAGEEILSVTFDETPTDRPHRCDTAAEVVGLLYDARNRFSTVYATTRTWGSKEETRAIGRPKPTSRQAEWEKTSKLWADNPMRFRKDDTSGLVIRLLNKIKVFRALKAYMDADLYEDAEYAIIAQTPLDPSWLISALWMEPVERTTHVGREAIRVRAEPVDDDDLRWYAWKDADEFELLVDAERGTLVRIGVRQGGEEFAGIEVTSIEFDSPIPDGVFAFSPPPGPNARATRAGGADR